MKTGSCFLTWALLILTVCIAGIVFSLTNDRVLAVMSGMFLFVIFFPPCVE
jgi:hypothetical protein